jgi:Fic family protein
LLKVLTLLSSAASRPSLPVRGTLRAQKRTGLHTKPVDARRILVQFGDFRLHSPQKMRRLYIHELKDWPSFGWKREKLAEPLALVRHRQGRLIGRMEALGFNLRQEAVLRTLTADVVQSSEIEGESLDAEQVRSSIARRLGMDIGALKPVDRNVEGVVEMTLDATRHYEQPLTADRLFAWHASLFPTGWSGMTRIRAGVWRDDSTGPMQVVSGPIGKGVRPFRSAKGSTP